MNSDCYAAIEIQIIGKSDGFGSDNGAYDGLP
jgi:hypothetical protein